MSRTSCCVPDCETADTDLLHFFPHPEKKKELFNAWVNSIGGEILELSPKFLYTNRRVCNKHFEKTFILRKKLCRTAIPTLFINASTSQEVIDNEDVEVINNGPITPDGSLSLNQECRKRLHTATSSQKVRDSENNSTEVENIAPTSSFNVLSKQTLTKQISTRSKSKRFHVHKLSGKQLDIYQELIAVRGKLRNIVKKKKTASQRIKMAEQFTKKKSFDVFTKNMTLSAKIFTNMQFRETAKSSKGRRFNLDEKILSLSLYKQSPKAYRLLSKMFTLPGKTTLNKLLQGIHIKPGINTIQFDHLKAKVQQMPSKHRVCTVLFDEVKLKPHLFYSTKNDKIIGFSDTGTAQCAEIADHALVFMIRGVFKKYKQPVCYSFCQKTTSAAELAFQIKTVIKSLTEIGLEVVATICDQGPTNRSAVKILLSETKAKYLRSEQSWTGGFFEIATKKIIPLYDPPHLLKSIRNNLLTKMLKYQQNGKLHLAKWAHIEAAYEKDTSYRGIKRMHRLTELHVKQNKIPKMKVKYASQIFSSSVGVNIGCMTVEGRLPKECQDTADLLLFFDDLFDSVNGNFSEVTNGKIYRCAVTKNSPHILLWKRSLPVLRSMRFIDKKGAIGSVPSLSGWVSTIEGFILLTDRLKQEYGITSFLPRHLNQDPLENFFGMIRSHGSRNNMPTCMNFTSAYKTLLLNNFQCSRSIASNCEGDDSDVLQSLRYLITESSQTQVCNAINEVQGEHLFIDSKIGDSVKEDSVVNYVCGYVLKKAHSVFKNCGNCRNDLLDGNVDANKSKHRFTLAKERFTKRHLKYPSEQLQSFFTEMLCITWRLLDDECCRNNLSQYVETILHVHLDFNFISCNIHRKELIDFLIKFSLIFFINNWCKAINKILRGHTTDSSDEKMKKKAADYAKKHSKCLNKKY